MCSLRRRVRLGYCDSAVSDVLCSAVDAGFTYTLSAMVWFFFLFLFLAILTTLSAVLMWIDV
jgi:hypothetical protein